MVEVKDVYGQAKIYPVCMEAQIFAEIAGTKTLLPQDIKRIQMLGYEVKVKQQTYADNLRAELDYFHRRPNKC
jgi:hypothetical protein